MRPQTDRPDTLDQRTALLLEAVEVLVEELSTLSNEDWEKLAELKKKKVVVASRLRRTRAEAEAADGAPIESIESLIANLEDQSRRNIRARLDLIGKQVVALQELGLYWRECLNVTFRRAAHRSVGPDATGVD